jgi:hypothetical protein
MDAFILLKSKGSHRNNPDQKKNWKKYKVNKGCLRIRRKNMKLGNVRTRRIRMRLIEDQDHHHYRYENSGKLEKIKDMAYAWENVYKEDKVQYAIIKRSGKYCSVCDELFCEHRAKESAHLILHSRDSRDGDFSNFPRDIALIIANLVYGAQLSYVDFIATYRIGGFPFTPCAHTEVNHPSFHSVVSNNIRG